jgi:hypothetical protein
MNSTPEVLNDVLLNVDQVAIELIEAARGAGADENEDPFPAQLVAHAATPEGFGDIRDFTVETLCAFGVCAHAIPFDDEKSSRAIKALILRFPFLMWAQNCYRDEVSLQDLNPGLLLDATGEQIAIARLGAWFE